MRDIMQSVFLPLTDHIMHYGVYFRTIFIPPLFIQSLAVTFNDAAERAFQYLQNCNVLLKVKDILFLNLIMEYPRI